MKMNFCAFTMLLLILSGCEEILEADPDFIQFGSEAESVTFKIKSNLAWTIEISAGWLSAVPLSGTDNALITLHCTENIESLPRDAIVTIKGGDTEPTDVLVSQDAASGFHISWKEKTSMPTERCFSAPNACIIDGIIYVIGGANSDGVPLDAVEAYDPISDKWTSKAPLINARWGHSADVVDGKIYVMGGCLTTSGNATTDMEVYDPGSDSWSALGNMRSERVGFGSCSVNGKIYVMGGRVADPGGDHLSSVEVYDPSTMLWNSLSPIPSAKSYFSAVALNNEIFAAGGALPDGSGAAVATVYRYDISQNSWKTELMLNQGRWGIATCVADSLIVCAGGYTGGMGSGAPVKTVEIIHCNTGAIRETTEILYEESNSSVCHLNGKIYLFGGANLAPGIYGSTSHVQEGTIIIP